MAYSPRTDLLTPHTAPDTQGYGPGIAAGMSSFSSLVSQGLTAQRQDQRDTKLWDQALQRDEANYANKASLMGQRTGMAQQKELATKAEEADFAAGAWDAIKQRMPEVITPEMDEKFVSGSLGTKRGLLVQSQAALTAAMKSELAKQQDEQDRQVFADQVPGTGKIVYGRGRNVMGSVDAWQNQGPAGSPPAPGASMWEGQAPTFDEVPENPSYFQQMPGRPVKPSAQPALAPNPATPAAPAQRNAASYFGR